MTSDERAEFARVQTEREALPTWDERHAALSARERRLLSAHGTGWVPEAPCEYLFRGGVIERVCGPARALKQAAPELEALGTVREVTLVRTDDPGETAALTWLANRPLWRTVHTLRAKTGIGGRPDIAGVAKLCASQEMTGLRRLDLEESLMMGEVEPFRALLALPALRTLERLQADTVYLPSAGIAALRTADLPALRDVWLFDCRKPGPAVMAKLLADADQRGWCFRQSAQEWGEPLHRHMAACVERGATTSIFLQCAGTFDALMDLPAWGNLEQLTIAIYPPYPPGWEARLGRHPGLAGLRSLRLWVMNESTGPALEGFAGGGPCLEELSIRFRPERAGPYTSALLKAIARPGAFPRLRHLTISAGDVPAEEMAAFAASPVAAGLRSLRLTGTRMGQPALMELARGGLGLLNEMDIHTSASASPDLVLAFARNAAMPHLWGLTTFMGTAGKFPQEAVKELMASRLTRLRGDWQDRCPKVTKERLQQRFADRDARLGVIEPDEE